MWLYFSESIFKQNKPHWKIHFATWDIHVLIWLSSFEAFSRYSDLSPPLGTTQGESDKTIMLLLYVLAFYQTWSHLKIIFVARVIRFLVQTAQIEVHLGAAHFEKSYPPHFKSKLHIFYMLKSSLSLLSYKIGFKAF